MKKTELKTKDRQIFANNVRRAVQKCGLLTFSQLSGVSVYTLTNMMAGRNYERDSAEKISIALDVSMANLYSDPQNSVDVSKEFLEKARELVCALDQILNHLRG